MIINMEFDTVYTEFERHTSARSAFEEIINPLNKTVLINPNTGASNNNIFSDTKTEENNSKGSLYYAFKKQVDKAKVFLPKNNNKK